MSFIGPTFPTKLNEATTDEMVVDLARALARSLAVAHHEAEIKAKAHPEKTNDIAKP